MNWNYLMLSRDLFVIPFILYSASLCTLRTKLTHNLDAWLACWKKICILRSLDVLPFECPMEQERARSAQSVSYCRIQPINMRGR